ncbi:RodZ domain-containing protein [Streptococcus equinus]|uniref:helix-turn-helix domain-containing protein n=1 Tax=Streptococcus equinus TaxID=1335 RepID=UPI003BF89F9B
MREETIGEILRKGRVAKNLTLEEVEEKTAIPSPHLLALELEKFKLIPADEVEEYLTQYADLVDVDSAKLLKRYRELTNGKTQKGSAVAEDEKITIVPSHKQAVKPVQKQEVENKDEFGVGSRSSRYKSAEKSTTYLPIVMLCVVALAILAFVTFVTWSQLQTDSNNNSKPSYSVVHSSSSESSSSTSETSTSESSSEEKGLKMETEGSGSNLTVNVSNVSDTDNLTVDIKLSGADSSWVSVSNSENGEGGTLLSSAGNTSFSTALVAGAKTSVITLGVTEGVTVSINGQEVDMSALTSTTVSYITINIQ